MNSLEGPVLVAGDLGCQQEEFALFKRAKEKQNDFQGNGCPTGKASLCELRPKLGPGVSWQWSAGCPGRLWLAAASHALR